MSSLFHIRRLTPLLFSRERIKALGFHLHELCRSPSNRNLSSFLAIAMQLTLATALALLPLIASASPTPEPAGTKIPLTRRSFQTKEGTADVRALNTHLAHVQT